MESGETMDPEGIRDGDQSTEWPSVDFDNSEIHKDAGGDAPDDAQGVLQFPADRNELPDDGLSDRGSDTSLDLFDDTFEAGFIAEIGVPDRSENDEAMDVPEFVSFAIEEDREEAREETFSESMTSSDVADSLPLLDPTDDDDLSDEETEELSIPAMRIEEDDDGENRGSEMLTSDQYLHATTQEFVDLAEEIERASAREHVPIAVAAAIPGVESGVIGLDDVVVAAGEDPADIKPRSGSDLSLRILTGFGMAVIFFVSLYAPLLIGLFVFLVLMTVSVEFYSAMMRAGHRPVGFFGVLGTAGALLGTWMWGPQAIGVSLVATFIVTMIFFAVRGGQQATLTNAGLTVLGAGWVGGLGAFIFDMVQSDNYVWLVVATIVTVALMDMAQFFFGRRLGRIKLAPRISPHKTVEGLIGGMIVAVMVGLSFGLLQDPVLFLDLESPIDLGAGLAIGLVVAGSAPLGDLAVSAIKRSISVKDMGTILPGHGGLFDRIDAMLFAIPLTWIVFVWTGLLV